MDRPNPHFSFITPSPPSLSASGADEHDAQKQSNVLRWQAFGVELNRVPSRGVAADDVAALTTPPRRTRDDDAASDERSGAIRSGHGSAVLNDVVTPPRYRPGTATSTRASTAAPNPRVPAPSPVARRISGVARAVPDYKSLLAQDDQYVASVASSMQWLSQTGSATTTAAKGVVASPHGADATSSMWTASWNVAKAHLDAASAPASLTTRTRGTAIASIPTHPSALQRETARASPPPLPDRSVASSSSFGVVATARASDKGETDPPPPVDEREEEKVNPLLRHLHSLSERVASATELQRCGPPRKATGGGGGGGSGGGRPAFFKKTKKSKSAAADADADADDDGMKGGNPEAQEPSLDDSDTHAAEGGTRAAQSRKRPRAKASAAKPNAKKTATAKTTERVHPWQQQPEKSSGTESNARRTVLPFYSSKDGIAGAAAPGGAAADGVDKMGVVGGAGAVPLVSAVPYERLNDTHALFQDVQDVLNDPDRIQAPPLFVGFATSSATGLYSNFSISSSWGGKLHFAPHIDPQHAHRCVEWFVLRWREKVYVLPAHIGFPFLVRVLDELIGVELITFHAPALMLVLLSFANSSTSRAPLTTHCVSDVRVMAWMSMTSSQGAQTESAAIGGGRPNTAQMPSSLQQQQQTAVKRGGAGVEELCDVNTLFALHLNKQVMTPLPSSNSTTTTTTATLLVSNPEDAQQREKAFLQALVNQVYYLSPLYRTLYGQLGMRGLLQAFIRQEKGIALLLAAMKRNGMLVDMAAVHQFQASCLQDMRTWRLKAEALVPGLMPGFNLQSPDQCRRAIYEELQLGRYLLEAAPGGESVGGGDRANGISSATAPSLTVTKTGKLSTAEETLKLLAQHHPFPLYLLRYRKAAKLLQTYVEGMMVAYAIPCTDPEADDGESRQGALLPDGKEPVDMDNDLFSDDMAAQLEACVGDGDENDEEDESKAALIAGSATTTTSGHTGSRGSSASPSRGGSRALPKTRYARVHANFLQEGTDTGRLSCAEPNLQNLPRPTTTVVAPGGNNNNSNNNNSSSSGAVEQVSPQSPEAEENAEEERAFRRCFVAPPGHVLVSVDYEQIELRVLAHLCSDPALVNALTHSVDIHSAIAQQVFKKPSVTSEERSMAKRVVFGVLYGAGPRTLAAQMGVSVERAVQVSALLRSAYPQIDVYHQRVLQQARSEGFVRTMSGRLRYLPDVNSGVMGKRAYAERQAFNTVVQGTAADVMKLSMLSVERHVLQVWPRDVRLLSQIHDELVLSVAKPKLPEVVPALVKAMSQAVTLLVPLKLAVKFGPTLGDLHPWTVDHDLGIGDI